MLIIHHYFPTITPNIGDRLVAKAIRVALMRHFGDIHVVEKPINDRCQVAGEAYGLRGRLLQESNEQADLIVVGGSNLLQPRKRGRWGVVTDLSSVDSIRAPLLLVGMGTGSDFCRRIRRYQSPAKQEVCALFEKAFASAVRDVATVQQLQKINVHAICTGCPVTFLTEARIKYVDCAAPLLISFPPERITTRRKGRSFMRRFIDYILWLQKNDIPIRIALHDERDIDLADRLVPCDVEICNMTDVDELIELTESSIGVIGFRLHAALLAIGLGRPAIPIGLDWRGKGFIETFELQSLSMIDLGRVGFQRLRELTMRLVKADPSITDQINRAKSKYLLRHHDFFADAACQYTA